MSDQAMEQSPSIESRAVEALFGTPAQKPVEQQSQQAEEVQGSEEGQPEGTETPAQPEFEEIEYEGERFQVPPKLKKGLMLQKDYTQKTQSHAEAVKSFEVAQGQMKLAQQQRQFFESVAAERDQLKMLDAYLAQPLDSNLPIEELLRQRMDRDTVRDRRNALDAELGRKEVEFNASLRKQHEELQSKAREVLARKIPGWNAEVEKDVKDWAISQGFTSEEVSAILNPVHAETLYKARQYDKLVANKSAAEAQAAKATPMVKPGSANPMPQAVKDQFAFKRALSKATPGTAEHKQLVEKRAGSLFSKR